MNEQIRGSVAKATGAKAKGEEGWWTTVVRRKLVATKSSKRRRDGMAQLCVRSAAAFGSSSAPLRPNCRNTLSARSPVWVFAERSLMLR